MGTFDMIHGNADVLLQPAAVFAGRRRCPNPDCHTYVTVTYVPGGPVLAYPPELIDFDATNIPTPVVEALEEAIKCHSTECYIAAAIMVRKTLEALCADRDAKGETLVERIRALGDKVVLPAEYLEGLDELRLLGNDAAHIESKVYERVGKEEVEVGIEFAKEVLKAVYQSAELLRRLRALKRDVE